MVKFRNVKSCIPLNCGWGVGMQIAGSPSFKCQEYGEEYEAVKGKKEK